MECAVSSFELNMWDHWACWDLGWWLLSSGVSFLWYFWVERPGHFRRREAWTLLSGERRERGEVWPTWRCGSLWVLRGGLRVAQGRGAGLLGGLRVAGGGLSQLGICSGYVSPLEGVHLHVDVPGQWGSPGQGGAALRVPGRRVLGHWLVPIHGFLKIIFAINTLALFHVPRLVIKPLGVGVWRKEILDLKGNKEWREVGTETWLPSSCTSQSSTSRRSPRDRRRRGRGGRPRPPRRTPRPAGRGCSPPPGPGSERRDCRCRDRTPLLSPPCWTSLTTAAPGRPVTSQILGCFLGKKSVRLKLFTVKRKLSHNTQLWRGEI